MDAPVVEDAMVQSEAGAVRLDIFQGENGGLFHHIAQISCQVQARVSALADTGFNKQNLTAHSCPCQSCYHASIFVTLVDIAVINRLAQQFGNGCWLKCGFPFLAFGFIAQSNAKGHLAKDFLQLLFQLSHATFARIGFYHTLYGS